jgi:N,N'-diacetylchitobiose transport system permease protein
MSATATALATAAAAAPTRRRGTETILTLLTFAAILAIFVFPMLWIVLKSIQPESEVFTNTIAPQHFTFDNYARAIKSGFLGQYTASTVILSLWTCVFVLPMGFLAGYVLARFRFVGRDVVLFLFMFSLTASNLPLATWLSRAFVLSIPVELEQAGLVDGCSRLGAIWRIVLPLAVSGLGAVAVFVVVNVFQEFIVAQTLITTRGVGVVSQGLRLMQSQYSLDYSALAAGSILVSVVPVALFLILQRQFIAGMTAGSVTG